MRADFLIALLRVQPKFIHELGYLGTADTCVLLSAAGVREETSQDIPPPLVQDTKGGLDS